MESMHYHRPASVADAVKLDPIGIGEPVVAVARRRPRPAEQLVVGAPDDSHRALDPLGVATFVVLDSRHPSGTITRVG